jgi:hypothetical protein
MAAAIGYHAAMPATNAPIQTPSNVHAALLELFRKRLKHRFKRHGKYRLCELWSTDNPPDILSETSMAGRLDAIVGFTLSDEELMIAYDLEDLHAAAIYLFNLMKDRPSADAPTTSKPLKTRRNT